MIRGFWILFAAFSLSTGVVCSAQPKPEGRLAESPHQFQLGSRGDIYLNDNPGLFSYLRPYFQYRYQSSEIRLDALVAYKHNRLILKRELNTNWAYHFRVDVDISNDGDSPVIDGRDIDAYKFTAHTYRGLAGLDWTSKVNGLPLQVQFDAGSRYFQIYDKSDQTSVFTNPKNFYENTLQFRFDVGASFPQSELTDFGVRSSLSAGYFNRLGNRSWGSRGAERKISNYGRVSAGTRWSKRLMRSLTLVTGVQSSSILGKTDRLNAIRGGNFNQRDESLFVGWVRASRAVSGDLGLRIYLEDRGYFAVRPFGYAIAYREILPDAESRNDAAIGGGIKLMARLGSHVNSDLTYALGTGNRTDKNLIHQLKYSISARF